MALYSVEQQKALSAFLGNRFDEFNELLEGFGEFVEEEILPTAEEIDKRAIFPKENVEKVFKQGFAQIPFPINVGGLGLPYLVYIGCMEILSKACASTAISLEIHGAVCDGLLQFGTEVQHKKYLGPLIRGEKLGAFCLTEPDSGSDAGAMKTKAELVGDHWLINGSKMYITNSGVADIYMVFARTKNGYAAILVPRDAKGLKIGANIPKLGLKGSSLAALNFDDVEVPAENLLGEDGMGFEYAKRMLYGGRIAIAAMSVGIAQIAFDKTVSYSKERVAFGQKLSKFQITRSKIAEMATEIEAARLSTYFAASLKGSGREFEREACEAKLLSTEMALKVCNEAIQMHGGYGYTDEADVHRHWRDAKLMTIGEGTSEIMKVIIANHILGPE
jgi:butyryl-CoA dehydrogenase